MNQSAVLNLDSCLIIACTFMKEKLV